MPLLFELSNQSALVAAYGQHFTYANTSRARIFRRDQVREVGEQGGSRLALLRRTLPFMVLLLQGTVVNETTLRRLMRYNDFEVGHFRRGVCCQCSFGPGFPPYACPCIRVYSTTPTRCKAAKMASPPHPTQLLIVPTSHRRLLCAPRELDSR